MRAENPNAKVVAANAGLTICYNGMAQFDGTVRTRPDLLDLPLRTRKPQVWSVWTDLWHELVDGEFIRKCLAFIRKADRHIFVACTKRAERMCRLSNGWAKRHILWPKNLIAMVTAENQEQADKRIPWLLKTQAAYRAVALEPILGEIDLSAVPGLYDGDGHDMPWMKRGTLHWVTIGQETGRHARPASINWFRKVRDDCHQDGIPLFAKRTPHGLSIIDEVEYRELPPQLKEPDHG
jgi:protein gp37